MRTVREVLNGVQDLWRYGTGEWLTYRSPTPDPRARRWPVDPIWEQIQAVRIAPDQLGVVRRRLDQATEERLVQGLQGYLTSLAALKGWRDLAATVSAVGPLVVAYLAARERTFEGDIQHKVARLMSVTGWLDGESP